MKLLTIIVLGKKFNIRKRLGVDILYAENESFFGNLDKINSKYVTFVKEGDSVSDDYVDILLKKCKEDFDCCFINYIIKYNYINKPKIPALDIGELKKNKPYYGEYIWNFIFDKNKLIEILDYPKEDFNKAVDEEFKNIEVISDVIYFHNPNGVKFIKDSCYNDVKRSQYYENIIYVAGGCNGIFNGYVSWIKNIGRCFADKYDVTILFDEMCGPTYDYFSKKFRCVKLDRTINYVAARLLVTYASYYYPRNIHYMEENYMFIHGNMSDYPHSRRFTEDLYTKYIAVSKVAADKAKGYFPTDNIEYILNPFKIDDELLKPHLKLVSAQRSGPEKKPERLKIVADALNELGIPFTWNVFMDSHPCVNENGLIYRGSIENPLPYVQDCDYFVSLSNTEALGYSVLEALVLKTKVLVTPLEAFDELGVKDGENGYIIPFECFEEEHKDELLEILEKAYKNKNKTFDYEFNEDRFDGYNDIFI